MKLVILALTMGLSFIRPDVGRVYNEETIITSDGNLWWYDDTNGNQFVVIFNNMGTASVYDDIIMGTIPVK